MYIYYHFVVYSLHCKFNLGIALDKFGTNSTGSIVPSSISSKSNWLSPLENH